MSEGTERSSATRKPNDVGNLRAQARSRNLAPRSGKKRGRERGTGTRKKEEKF